MNYKELSKEVIHSPTGISMEKNKNIRTETEP